MSSPLRLLIQQEAQLMLTDPISMLFEVQRVTSPRLPRQLGLIALFSTYCRQNRIHTVLSN